MAVHSARLGAMQVTSATPTTIYTAPVGHRTILKSVSCFNSFSGLNRLQLTITHSGTTIAFMNFMMDAIDTIGEAQHVDVWQVLNAGDLLRAAVTHNGVYMVASGAELLI